MGLRLPHRRVVPFAAAAVLLPAVAGCGGSSGGDYANDPRPPAPINVTVAITEKKIAVSPDRFGAGPIVLVISNQTKRNQTVILETDELGGSQPGLKEQTSPVLANGGTEDLKVDVREGTYSLHTGDSSIKPASIDVGGPRPSAQNDVLQP